MEKIVVTDEMRRAVYEEECQYEGHRCNIVGTHGTADPAYIVCERCGKGWTVINNDEIRGPLPNRGPTYDR